MATGPLTGRTKDFALRVIRLYTALPKNGVCQVIGPQVLRSATSAGASYREGAASRSRTEFTAKLEVVERELKERAYWLELLEEGG